MKIPRAEKNPLPPTHAARVSKRSPACQKPQRRDKASRNSLEFALVASCRLFASAGLTGGVRIWCGRCNGQHRCLGQRTVPWPVVLPVETRFCSLVEATKRHYDRSSWDEEGQKGCRCWLHEEASSSYSVIALHYFVRATGRSLSLQLS